MSKRNVTFTRVLKVPEHVYLEAERRAKNQKIFKLSHRKDEANSVGCLGEVLAEYWMKQHGIPFVSELEKTTHDYIVGNNLKIDVKAKDRISAPKSFYDNSAPLYNHEHQRPDYFFFISLERNSSNKSKDIRRFHTAYILGSISYQELDRVGIPFLKDEKDWRNGTKFWTDCLNVEMWQLIPLKETVDIFKGNIDKPSVDAGLNFKIINEMKKRISHGKLKDRKLPA
jgi:hypothetical protein